MNLQWQSVDSTNVKEVAFDVVRGLFVRFHSGGTYRYKDVSRQRFNALMEAPSIGSYVQNTIKPHYDVEKIDD